MFTICTVLPTQSWFANASGSTFFCRLHLQIFLKKTQREKNKHCAYSYRCVSAAAHRDISKHTSRVLKQFALHWKCCVTLYLKQNTYISSQHICWIDNRACYFYLITQIWFHKLWEAQYFTISQVTLTPAANTALFSPALWLIYLFLITPGLLWVYN